MSNPLIPKRNSDQTSTAAPLPSALNQGEIASNLTSGSLYLKLYDGSVVDVGPVKSVAGQTGNVTLSTSDISGLGTASTKDVPATGDADSSEVVLGSDSRLTDSRSPSGAAGGDLRGFYPNPIVDRIQDQGVSSDYPTPGQVFTFTGSHQWKGVTLAVTTDQIACLTTSAIAGLVPQLDGTGHISLDQIPSAIIGALNYQGLWDANANSPTLTSGVGTKGYYYVVSVAGNTMLNGHNDWLVGDLVVFDGTAWDKVPGNDSQVISVNGVAPIHGNVTLVPSDIGAVSTTQLGALNGVATLDGAGHLYTSQLAAATTSQIGGIIVGNNLTITPDGVLSGVNSYSLPPATTSTLGGIIAGAGTAVQLDGTLSVPVATYTDAGRVKPGMGLKFIGVDGEIVPDEQYTITVATPPTVFNGGTY